MKNQFRPTAIPLIACDPYFSIWSFTDSLTDDCTRHWTGKQQSMCGVLTVDGEHFRFMGKTEVFDRYFPEGDALEQVSVEITPTASIYTFAHPACQLKVTFLTPLLLDRPEVFSRPVSYVFYEITPTEKGHTFEVYFDVSAQLCGDDHGQRFVCDIRDGHVSVGAAVQKVLNSCGDDHRIDWGYLHLVHPNAQVGRIYNRRHFFKQRHSTHWTAWKYNGTPVPYDQMPILYTTSQKLKDCFVVAYDDIHSVLHYHTPVDAYYKTVYGDFETMLKAASDETDLLRADCEAFDKKLMTAMEKISDDYANIGSLAYRQAVSAHNLVDVNGKMYFISKENFSNGCLATLDVTYPSIPLFLLLNPELVKGMMRPIFEFARKNVWRFDFAPHDCGCYPFCNGQVYSADKLGNMLEEKQMPVEECGNAILTVAAALKADGDRSLLEENADLLKTWADYLMEYGYDPANQLCTDDFAGHLARNCNLSIKAIVALGAYGQMCNAPEYSKAAKEMADRWTVEAKRQSGKGWRLTFDHDDTWSMKYNIIWDRLLGLGLFDAKVFEEEVEVYTEKMNRYGVPLDSRDDYTKLDWMAWTTVMTENVDYTKAVYESIARMICEARDRVPITDWYRTINARQVGFQARSVLGGFYINLLKNWIK